MNPNFRTPKLENQEMTEAKIIDKIKKLLALGGSNNEHESAAAIARAQAIMETHNISAGMVAEDDEEEPGPIEDWEEPVAKAGARWRGQIVSAIARANGCHAWRSGNQFMIAGRADNAATTRYIVGYCIREVDRFAALKRGNGASWINNYRLGLVDAISAAVKKERNAARERARAAASDEHALVVVDNAIAKIDKETREVIDWVHSRYNLGKSSRHRTRHNPGARDAGRRDGAAIYGGAGEREKIGGGVRRLN